MDEAGVRIPVIAKIEIGLAISDRVAIMDEAGACDALTRAARRR